MRSTLPPLRAIVLLGLGIVLSPGLIGIPLLAAGVGETLEWAHATETRRKPLRILAAGWTAMLVLGAAVVCGVMTGFALVDVIGLALGDDDVGALATFVIAPLVAAMLFAPLAFAPSLVLLERPSWLVESVWLAAHVGAARITALGAMLGAHVAIPIAITIAAGAIDESLGFLTFLGAFGMSALLAPVTLLAVGRSYERAVEETEDGDRAFGALRAIVRLALVPLAITTGVAMVALVAPLPLQKGPAEETGGEPSPTRLPGTDVWVEYGYHSLSVWNDAEGRGSARRYVMDGYAYDAEIAVREVRYGGRPAFRVTISDWYEIGHSLVLDREGRRLDDGLAQRIVRHAPSHVIGLLLIAIGLALVFVVASGRVLARAQLLQRMMSRAAGSSAAGIDVVAGTLRVAGAPVQLRAGRLYASGGAYVEAEGGAIRVALPETVGVVASALDGSADLLDGTDVMILARGARIGGVGPRDAAAAWPAGAEVVLGDPALARAALVRASFPRLVRLGLALGAALFVAGVAIGTSGG